MASSNSQTDKPQCGRPVIAELPDININTGIQSINTDTTSLKYWFIYLRLNEAKHNERDDKWFLKFPSEMIVWKCCYMCEA